MTERLAWEWSPRNPARGPRAVLLRPECSWSFSLWELKYSSAARLIFKLSGFQINSTLWSEFGWMSWK